MLNKENVENFLIRKYRNDLFLKRKFQAATIEILNSCNFKCVHCYNQNLKPHIMDVDMFCDIVDQLSLMGCKHITITGGEPLLHPQFKILYKYCFDKNISVCLFTNGFFIDKYLDFFCKFPPKKIEISLYGVTNETYEKVCKIGNNLFDKVVENINKLKANNFNLNLKTVIMQQNYTEFDKMIKFCEKLNLPFRFDANILNSKDNSNDQKENKLKNEQYSFIMQNISQLKIKNWESYLYRENLVGKSDFLYSCGAGRISLFINCRGGVRLCNFAEFSEINVKDKPIKLIWEDFGKYLTLKKDTTSKCYNCKYKNFCSICPVITYTEHHTNGTTILPVKQNCREAQFIYQSVKNYEKTKSKTIPSKKD